MTIDGKTLSAWDGVYCPENQTLPKLCEAGYYCDSRNGTTRKICPEGSFCPWGSSEPMPCPWPIYCAEGSKQQPITFFTILIVLEALFVKIAVSLYGPAKKLYHQAELLVEDALHQDDHPEIRRKHMERMKRNRQIVSRNEGRKTRTRRRLRVLKAMALMANKAPRGRLFSLVNEHKDRIRLDSSDRLDLPRKERSDSGELILESASPADLAVIGEQRSDEDTTEVVPFPGAGAAAKETSGALAVMSPAQKKIANMKTKTSSIKNLKVNCISSRKSFTSFTTYRMPQKKDRISLEFENLVLTVGKQQKVLNGVSGFIEGGAGVAIMGESGCVSAYTLASTYNHKLRLTV